MADPSYWQYLWRCALAFVLGIFSFVAGMFAFEGLGDFGTLGIVAGVICMSIYFFLCQFPLSLRENNDLFYNRVVGSNMPIIVALDLPWTIMVLMMLYGEKNASVFRGVPLLLFACASSCAGAAMALFVARRKVGHPG